MNSKEFLEIVGARIRTYRKTKKISQERLAELSGLHPTYISDIERGKVNASIYTLYMVAKALDIQISDLVSISAGKIDKKIETEITALLSLTRNLDKKKQIVFLSAARGLINGIEQI